MGPPRPFPPVLLDGFQMESLSWEHSLVARGVPRRREELEFSMAATKEEPHFDTSREADNREEEPIKIEGLEDPLHGTAIDAERDGRHTEVQTAADHVLGGQEVLPRVSDQAWHVSCTQITGKKSEVRGPAEPVGSGDKGRY